MEKKIKFFGLNMWETYIEDNIVKINSFKIKNIS